MLVVARDRKRSRFPGTAERRQSGVDNLTSDQIKRLMLINSVTATYLRMKYEVVRSVIDT